MAGRANIAKHPIHTMLVPFPIGLWIFSLACDITRRTLHVRFNDLKDPEPIPRGVDYASVIESDVPVVVQHTRLDSRQSENALISTVAYAAA